MTLRLHSVWYGAEGGPYSRMARVLEHTARKYHRHVRVECLGGAFTGDRSDAFRLKARDWTRVIREGKKGDVIALLDADTFLQRSLNVICASHFDIAVTRHSGRLNSGVVFVRPSSKVDAFFAPWAEKTDTWCDRNTESNIKFGDQDALDVMLAFASPELRILTLQMREWNSTQRTWHRNLDDARIVHFKSKAREYVFRGDECNALSKHVAERWLAQEREILQ